MEEACILLNDYFIISFCMSEQDILQDFVLRENLGELIIDLQLRCGRQHHDGVHEAIDVHVDEVRVIHIHENAHQQLTVHAVSDATMTGDALAKVLDLNSTLEAGREEAAKWCDKRCKHRNHQRVNLQRHVRNRVNVHTHPAKMPMSVPIEGAVVRER